MDFLLHQHSQAHKEMRYHTNLCNFMGTELNCCIDQHMNLVMGKEFCFLCNLHNRMGLGYHFDRSKLNYLDLVEDWNMNLDMKQDCYCSQCSYSTELLSYHCTILKEFDLCFKRFNEIGKSLLG